MSKRGDLGKILWRRIERPQGEAYISDAVEDSSDTDALREAEVRLQAAKRVVNTLTNFIRQYGAKR